MSLPTGAYCGSLCAHGLASSHSSTTDVDSRILSFCTHDRNRRSITCRDARLASLAGPAFQTQPRNSSMSASNLSALSGSSDWPNLLQAQNTRAKPTSRRA